MPESKKKFKDYFLGIVKTVFGKIPKEDKEVRNILQDLDSEVSSTNDETFYDLLISIVKKNQANDVKSKNGEIDDDIKKILSDDFLSSDILLNDLFSRRKKYYEYSSISRKISRLKRALKVITSNIISSDSLNNKDLVVSIKNEDSLDAPKIKSETQRIIDHTKLEKLKSELVSKTLKYGDFGVEIINVDSVIQKMNLIESIKIDVNQKINNQSIASIKGNIILECVPTSNTNTSIRDVLLESAPLYSLLGDDPNTGIAPYGKERDQLVDNIIAEPEYEEDEKDNTIISSDEYKNRLSSIMLMPHDPHNYIKLTLNNMKIGYLIVPKFLLGGNNASYGAFSNITRPDSVLGGTTPIKSSFFGAFNSSFGQHSSQMSNGSYQQSNNGSQTLQHTIQLSDHILQFLCDKIDSRLVSENPELKPVIVELVYNLLSTGNLDSTSDKIKNLVLNDMKFRFVPVSHMQEFSIDIDEYAPYGTSIFDSIEFDAKLLLSTKIAATLERLTKSVERRIIHFPIDNVNSVGVVQRLQEKFRKSRVKFDASWSVDTISTAFSPFEDFFIPVKEGEPGVTFSELPRLGDVTARTDDMKFIRDEIVAAMDVPPAYLGLEENIESKSTLTLQNVVFAIMILDYQQTFSALLTDLIDKIKHIVNFRTSYKKATISFAPPIILSTSSEIEHIGSIQGIEEFLIKYGMTKEDVLKRYLPYLYEYSTVKEKVKQKISELEKKEKPDSEEEKMGGF